MSSLIQKRLCCKSLFRDPILKARALNWLSSSFSEPQFQYSSIPAHNHTVLAPPRAFLADKRGLFSSFYGKWGVPFGSNYMRYLSSQAAAEASTSDGLTVEGIIANNWLIYDENESDWKSHAAVIAQSIHLIKKRLRFNSALCLSELKSCEVLLFSIHVLESCYSRYRTFWKHFTQLWQTCYLIMVVQAEFWKELIRKLGLLSEELNRPDLWDDPSHAGKISREHGSILGKIKEATAFEQELFEHIDMIKLAREENDTELESESMNALLALRRNIKEKELEALLAGEHDPCPCFIEVQAGAGGTESMDWASMVMQMYKKWAESRQFRVTVVEEMAGEIAGIKRATIRVEGDYAYGYAKAEVGAHRLVRISPFDSNKRRHTSFASVAVIPILGADFSHVQINESDLKIERFRAGGAGGQHVNTTESAVRITHIPTGVTASCQNERSQHQNKASAMSVLQSRVDQLEIQRQAQINAEHTQSLTDINFGSQIRSYVLHPYRMVKDHRTDYEVSDPDSVLEGDLDGFILSYLTATLDKNEDY